MHKFDPVIRLPLVLGLGFLVDASVRAWRRRPSSEDWLATVPRRGVVVIAALALVGATTPALTGRLAPTDTFTEVPGYWYDAAAWLDEHDPDERALLVPASPFGTYLWGDTRDEPLQPLATRPWGVRNAIPLATIGNIRALGSVEERINRGLPSPGLATYLRRMGVTYLVVRNDLQPSATVTDPALVHQTLDGSPGLERVAGFGPPVGGETRVETDDGALVVDSGWQTRYDAIEVYEVTGDVRPPSRPRPCPPWPVRPRTCSRWPTATCSPTSRPGSPRRRPRRAGVRTRRAHRRAAAARHVLRLRARRLVADAHRGGGRLPRRPAGLRGHRRPPVR